MLTTRTPRARNPSAISIGTTLQPLRKPPCPVVRRQLKIPQNPLRQPRNIFQKHRLPLAVGADHKIMERQA